MKQLLEKYKDIILYLFFGVCTTGVNIAAYWLLAHPLGIGVMPATILAWLAAVLFAYFTNRKWVFRSTASGRAAIVKELVSFFGCRLATGVLDWACMYVFVNLLAWNDMVVKVGANVLVIILNYVASKLLIFRKKKADSV